MVPTQHDLDPADRADQEPIHSVLKYKDRLYIINSIESKRLYINM